MGAGTAGTTAQAKRSAGRPRAPRAAARPQVVLVLQGGGALGAYQAGVYEALHEAGIEPDWVIGTSIGAINAALIVGNEPGQRLQRLQSFWNTVSRTAAPGGMAPGIQAAWATMSLLGFGLAGFFTPFHRAWLGPHVPLQEHDAGYYRTAPLMRTLASLLDPARLNCGAPRLTVGAVSVRSGAMRYFDSRDEPLGLEHILGSGALPPAFPAVRIGDDLYWDGGIHSNTPVEAVLDDDPRRDSLIFAVQLWRAAGEAPRTMAQVTGRQRDIQFASRVDSHVRRQAQIHRLRHIVRELARELPQATRERSDIRQMIGYGCGTVMHMVRLVAPRLPDEDHTAAFDFDAGRIRARWAAGRTDARKAIERGAWLRPTDLMDGLVVHDLDP